MTNLPDREPQNTRGLGLTANRAAALCPSLRSRRRGMIPVPMPGMVTLGADISARISITAGERLSSLALIVLASDFSGDEPRLSQA